MSHGTARSVEDDETVDNLLFFCPELAEGRKPKAGKEFFYQLEADTNIGQ